MQMFDRSILGRRAAAALLAIGLLSGGLLSGGLLLPGVAAADDGPYGEGAAAAEVARFNDTMRRIYGDARSRLGSAARPVIFVGGEAVLLTPDGRRESRSYTPAVYHRLKAVDHVVLGLVGAVAPALEGLGQGDGWRAELEAIAAAIDSLEPQLGGLGLAPEQEERQRRMLAEVRDYIAAARQAEAPSREAFTALMARIKPLWLADAADAARAQLRQLDAIVRDWRSRMSPGEWERLMVVVSGPRNPRVGNLQASYFVRLLGEPGTGGRVIYAENLFDEESALRLLDVTVIDRALSLLVFGDRYRMEEDLLGFAAGSELDQLLSGQAAE